MDCPSCNGNGSRVVETREMQEENVTRRRRECTSCGDRFTTYERVAAPSLTVVKADGEEEPFDREKVRAGVERACEKRPVGEDEVAALVDGVVADIRGRGEDRVDSRAIGDAVMERLRAIDEVAYVRFASVYRSFDDVNEFEEAVRTVKDA